METESSLHHARRRSIGWLAAVLGAAIFLLSTSDNSVFAATPAQNNPTTVETENYPQPAYLPGDYRFAHVSERQSGFGGEQDIAFIYASPEFAGNVITLLTIHLSADPERQLSTFENGVSSEVRLQMANGDTVLATHYDGTWTQDPAVSDRFAPVWDTSDVHALVFDLEDFRIGIRASRAAGIDFDEIKRIAESFSR